MATISTKGLNRTTLDVGLERRKFAPTTRVTSGDDRFTIPEILNYSGRNDQARRMGTNDRIGENEERMRARRGNPFVQIIVSFSLFPLVQIELDVAAIVFVFQVLPSGRKRL